MGTTPLNGLPFPEPTDQPYVHLDIQRLAEETDERLAVVCTSTTRPEHRAGRRIYETNTGRTYISDGTTWQQIPRMQDIPEPPEPTPPMTMNSPSVAYGTYTGQPLRVIGGTSTNDSGSSATYVNISAENVNGIIGVSCTSAVAGISANFVWDKKASNMPNTLRFVKHPVSADGTSQREFSWMALVW